VSADPLLSHIKFNFPVLAHLLKSLSVDRFRRMARDEVLFKFIADRFDPAVLVDHLVQAEKEALELAEMSLLKLVDSEKLETQLHRSAEKIETHALAILRETGPVSEALLQARVSWLDARVQFYRRWLSISDHFDSPIDLARAAFRSAKNFQKALDIVIDSERKLADEIVRQTPPLHRFLVRKQMNFEMKSVEEIWEDFTKEAFRETPALP